MDAPWWYDYQTNLQNLENYLNTPNKNGLWARCLSAPVLTAESLNLCLNLISLPFISVGSIIKWGTKAVISLSEDTLKKTEFLDFAEVGKTAFLTGRLALGVLSSFIYGILFDVDYNMQSQIKLGLVLQKKDDASARSKKTDRNVDSSSPSSSGTNASAAAQQEQVLITELISQNIQVVAKALKAEFLTILKSSTKPSIKMLADKLGKIAENFSNLDSQEKLEGSRTSLVGVIVNLRKKVKDYSEAQNADGDRTKSDLDKLNGLLDALRTAYRQINELEWRSIST